VISKISSANRSDNGTNGTRPNNKDACENWIDFVVLADADTREEVSNNSGDYEHEQNSNDAADGDCAERERAAPSHAELNNTGGDSQTYDRCDEDCTHDALKA